MGRKIMRLQTAEGESLVSIPVEEPIPDRYVWRNREFVRVPDTDIYAEVEGEFRKETT